MSEQKPEYKTDALSAYRPQVKNANKHTARGLGMLGQSIQTDGIGDGITVTADGETISGAARLEKLADIMPGVKIVEIETDGNTLIVNKRVDIPNAKDPRALRLAVAHNRVPQIDLDWDVDVLREIAEAEAGALDSLFFETELNRIAGIQEEIDPNELWKGMPEFEQEDLSPAKSITVNFASMNDYEKFASLVGQKLTEKTRSIWYPQAQKINMTDIYKDES